MKKIRKKGLKANYGGATPEQVARVLLTKDRAKPKRRTKKAGA